MCACVYVRYISKSFKMCGKIKKTHAMAVSGGNSSNNLLHSSSSGSSDCLLAIQGDALSVYKFTIETDQKNSDLALYYFRTEGDSMTDDERTRIFNFYERDAPSSKRFVNIYDLSLGITNFTDHVVAMAQFGNRMKPHTQGRLKFAIAICTGTLQRGFLSMLLKLTPSHAPVYVVDTTQAAWEMFIAKNRQCVTDTTTTTT